MRTPPPETDLFASVWQLLDAVVLMQVQPTPEGELPCVLDTPAGPYLPTWLDLEHAKSRLGPGRLLRHTPMTDVVLSTVLTSQTGIIVEPDTPRAVLIPAEQRLALQPLAVPFPPGARTSWGDLPADAAPLRDELQACAERLTPLRRLWMARFRVEDARERAAVVYETDGGDAEGDALVVEALTAGTARVGPPFPVQTIGLADLPEGTREWLLDSVPTVWPSPAG